MEKRQRSRMGLSVQSLLVIAAAARCAASDPGAAYKDPHFAPGHDVIVHLFEWSWPNIGRECETLLGPNKFGGIQVSPVQENVIVESRPWWERYQPISYKLTTRSGNETQLRDMVRRCNRAGVRIYVDVVFNHMCAVQKTSPAKGTGGSTADPRLRDYPAVPYTAADFHGSCTIDTDDDLHKVRTCKLLGLLDLDQSREHVRGKIVNLMNTLIGMGVAGFRIDAAKHMSPDDLRVIYSRLNDLPGAEGFPRGARPFIYQEVFDGGAGSVNMYSELGRVTEFKYGSKLSNALKGNNQLKWLSSFGEAWSFMPRGDAVVFIDNHDTQRYNPVLTYKSSKQYKMATAFMLACPYGIPKLMSSFDFKDDNHGPPTDSGENIPWPAAFPAGWVYEHRWRQILNMVGFRTTVGSDSSITDWWDNGRNQIAFSRGNSGFIAINGDNHDLRADIHTKLPAGTYCDIISGNPVAGKCTGKTLHVTENGYIHVEILLWEEDGVIATHKNAKIK